MKGSGRRVKGREVGETRGVKVEGLGIGKGNKETKSHTSQNMSKRRKVIN